MTATSTDLNNNTSEFSGNFTNITTGINFITNEFEFSIFPNPTKDVATVVIENLEGREARLEVISSAGKVLQIIELEETIFRTNIEIDLNEYAPGIYWLKVSNERAIGIKKLILTR